ncbi:MAG: ABC transporter permease [Vicinamibacteria bacterium]
MRHGWVGDVVQDVRYGVRQLRRAPAFTASATAALALGIGAATVIFSAVDAVLLKPLPYAEPERLVVVLHDGRHPVAPATFGEIRTHAPSFSAVGVAELWTPNLSAEGGALSVPALRMTSGILEMTGARPLLGRAFTADEEEPGREHVVLLGHALWRRAFGGDPAVLGRAVRLDGTPFTVVGVMPPGFDFPPFWARGSQIWAPLALRDRLDNRRGRSLRLFAQLGPGVPIESARAEVAAVASRVEAEQPGTMKGLVVRPLKDVVVRGVRRALLVLLGAVGLLLLIACANVAHLLLARASGRAQEMAVRRALGAGRGRLARQVLAESGLVAGAGAAAGVALAFLGVRTLVAWHPASVPRIETMTLDLRVLAVAVAAAVLCALLFGLAPALQAARRDAQPDLRDGARGSTAAGGRRLRDGLVASEIALALVLLVGAGLLVRTFTALGAVDPGFDPKGVLTMVLSLSGSAENVPGRRAAFLRAAVARLAATPGVEAAGAINHLPLAGDLWGLEFLAEGRPVPAPGEEQTAAWRVVLPGYFRTMRLPLLRGRDFDERDVVGTAEVVIVNEALAAEQWPGRDPIGRALAVGDVRAPRWRTVVGVSKNAVRDALAAAPAAEVYVPYLQSAYLERPGPQYASMTIVLRATQDPASMGPAARAVVHALAPDAAVASVQTMEAVMRDGRAEPGLYVVLLGAFAGAALALAAIGIYGVVGYTVARRRQEIAIRLALGAGRADVLRLVVGQGMRAVALGAAAGLAGALLLGGALSSLLYGVRPADPATLASAVILLGAVALAATCVPARRAIAIRAEDALRHD